jgi:hypothetical protein
METVCGGNVCVGRENNKPTQETLLRTVRKIRNGALRRDVHLNETAKQTYSKFLDRENAADAKSRLQKQARAEAANFQSRRIRREVPVPGGPLNIQNAEPAHSHNWLSCLVERYFFRDSLTATPSRSLRSPSSIFPSKPRIRLRKPPHLPERPHSSEGESFFRGITSGLAGPLP